MIVHVLAMHLTAAAVAGLWQGLVLACLAAALLRIIPRASASLRHALLFAVFAITLFLPLVRFRTLPVGASQHAAIRLTPWFAVAVALIWLTASLVRAAALLSAWMRLRNVRARAVPVMLGGVSSFNGGSRRALLCESADVDSPTVIGFWQPRLLLPAWMLPILSAADLHQIALHECEHLRRYDDWTNLLLQIALVLSPLNPVLVWLERRIGVQRELACDAAVIASTAQPIAYATCLTRLAEQRMRHNKLVLALAAWERESELGQRVHALLSQSAAWSRTQSRAAACATALLLLAGSIGLANAPSIVQIMEVPQPAAAQLAAAPVAANKALSDRAVQADTMPRGLGIVPASFVIKPAKPHAKRKSTALHKSLLFTGVGASTPSAFQSTNLVTTSPVRNNRHAVRYVTTDFSIPYVAVPVGNGWLLFQL